MKYKIYTVNNMFFMTQNGSLLNFSNKQQIFLTLEFLIQTAYKGTATLKFFAEAQKGQDCELVLEFNEISDLKELFPEYFIRLR